MQAAISGDAPAHHAGAIDLFVDCGPPPTDPLAHLTALAATGARALLMEAGPEAARWLPHVGFTLRRQREAAGRHLILGRCS